MLTNSPNQTPAEDEGKTEYHFHSCVSGSDQLYPKIAAYILKRNAYI